MNKNLPSIYHFSNYNTSPLLKEYIEDFPKES